MAEDAVKPNLVEKENESLELQSTLKEVAVITDQFSYDKAIQARVAGQAWVKEVNATFDPIREAAHRAWKLTITQRDKIVEPVERQLKQINAALVNWDNEQRRLQREEQMRLEAIERKRLEDERLAEAEQMQTAGIDEESIDQHLSAPVVIDTPVIAAPTYEKSSAVNFRETWSAELVDLSSLVKAAAKDRSLLCYLKFDQPAANKMAQAQKSLMNVPGVKAVSTKTAVTGRY